MLTAIFPKYGSGIPAPNRLINFSKHVVINSMQIQTSHFKIILWLFQEKFSYSFYFINEAAVTFDNVGAVMRLKHHVQIHHHTFQFFFVSRTTHLLKSFFHFFCISWE